MKTIGLIGGMSWESTTTYYQLINRGINKKLGKNHSARCIVHSVDFQEIEELQYAGKWDELRSRMLAAGLSLKAAGAEFLVLCTNTMHKVCDTMEADTGLPFLHIAEAVGQAVREANIKTIGLLGTIFTMEQPFYRSILEQQFGLTVVVPEAEDRQSVNRIIYDELVKGKIREESRDRYVRIMDKLAAAGAEGIILGCTEIGLLVTEHQVPLFDSTPIHAAKAVEFSLR